MFCEFHPIAGPKIVYQVRLSMDTIIVYVFYIIECVQIKNRNLNSNMSDQLDSCSKLSMIRIN